ncbi:hypothetical protein HOQ56_gp38 [uncultured phage_MedDCM-OCT-S38-C3]|uniref:Uncharacterized protein n=1 Tax=uncultured phage_MedDCM-OCT-S38-C3 TaxID=2740803 RepID=A0A6S4PGX3_9CAUD|nr:hypothetical protein HOQ56_gp38 [uncultured phage_MedDCM-OCT-S38-C3]BAQ94463.1 hypothetical protein [uncultured phage_MedDCM-OCT-S38-C3]
MPEELLTIPEHTLKAAEALSLRDLLELQEGLLNAYTIRTLVHGASAFKRRHQVQGQQPPAAWLQLNQFLFLAGHELIDEAFQVVNDARKKSQAKPAGKKPSRPAANPGPDFKTLWTLSQKRGAEALQEWFKEEPGVQVFSRRAAIDWLKQKPWLNGHELEMHMDNAFKLLIEQEILVRVRTGQYLVVNTIPSPGKVH